MVPADRPDRLPAIEPIWPLTGGLWPRQLADAMAQALARLPSFPEWHDPALLRREGWPGFVDALRAVQAPAALPAEVNRTRLAYDELLADQVALALMRGRLRARPGRCLTGDGTLRAKALSRFGYTLTRSQQQSLAEIDADLASDRRMLRLLQGDVGSGKTLVALLAMLRAVEAGKQAAIMAPTEVLAKQHHRTLSRLSPAPVALLTGGVKGRARAQLLRGLKDGSVPLIVGTHALFQESVEYHDLALAVIDEQHRFGVDQRLLLGGKGELTDVLVMTATPIPRTLLLTQWGEMEVSRLTEKPPGRQTHTDVAALAGHFPRSARRGGAQAGRRCAGLLDLPAGGGERGDGPGGGGGALCRAASAVRRIGGPGAWAAGRGGARCHAGGVRARRVPIAGGDDRGGGRRRCTGSDGDGDRARRTLRPGATAPASRPGRTRCRGQLLPAAARGLGERCRHRRRLTLLRDTEDGFLIADEDFRLRGGGDVLGTKQSGLPGFRLADPIEHEALLHMANRDAAVLLGKDPKLTSERGRAVRMLLRLFEKAAAMRTLAAG